MAFDILVELPGKKIDWEGISKEVLRFQTVINIYPIPKNKVSGRHYLGIAVTTPVNDQKRQFITEALELMLAKEYKVVEMYSHRVITRQNLTQVVKLLF